MKKLLLFFALSLILIGCAVKPPLHKIAPPEAIIPEQADMDGDGIADNFDENPDVADSLTFDQWKASRDVVLNDWQTYLTAAESKKKRHSTTYDTVTIISAILGAGAGIFGLVDDESTVPSIGSLLTGTGTALFTQLHLQKNKQRSSDCYQTISREMTSFKGRWTDIDFPKNDIELSMYRQQRKEAYDRIGESCFRKD